MSAPVLVEQAYRYWTYWVVENGQWQFSQVAPGGTLPADGAVQGWRFAVTTVAGSSSAAPRTDPALAFQRACSDVQARAGTKRVAIVIDTGAAADAPEGQQPPAARSACAVVEQDATGAQALMSIAEPRVEDGLVCAVDGYPVGECAITVNMTSTGSAAPQLMDVLVNSQTSAGTTAPTTSTSAPAAETAGSPTGAIITAALLVVGLAIAWWLQRRRLRNRI